MCGISGFTFPDRERIDRMTHALRHRGPDGAHVFMDRSVSLGHNLLAITETPSVGSQPWISDDKRYALVYNGEIYNYLDLKRELERLGEVFHTRGDTEVLFAGLRREGHHFLRRLNGMFALAWYDRDAEMLMIARDRAGMKPLYYVERDGVLTFASELRGLLEDPDIPRALRHEVLSAFFSIGYLPGSATLLKDVHKVMPGEYKVFSLRDRKFLETGWQEDLSNDHERTAFDVEQFRETLGGAIIDHTMGLRPFGMYLSGGLDSSIVLHELVAHGIQKPRTFTTRFDTNDPRFNEDADIAQRLSREYGAEHDELLITERAFTDATSKAIDVIEEPRYHSSRPAYYLLAQEASKTCTVILTGDGGDEQYMGYPKYYRSAALSKLYQRYPTWVLNAALSLREAYQGKAPFGLPLRLNEPLTRWWYVSRLLTQRHANLFTFPFKVSSALSHLEHISMPCVQSPSHDFGNAVADFDRLFWLPEDSLTMTDKIGMHFGMEARFPFLDARVTNYASRISSEEKLQAPGTKGLIRKAYHDMLPTYVTEKRKSGWTAPVALWMRSQFGDMVREVLEPNFYNETAPLFNFELLQTYTASGSAHSQNSIKAFFPIFTFQMWAKQLRITL